MSWHFLTKQLIISAQVLLLALYGEKIEMRSIWPNFERHSFLCNMYIFYWHIQVTFLSAHILWYYFCEWMYVKLFILNKSEFILNTRKKMIYGSDKSYWYKETLLRFRPYRDILKGCGVFHFTFFFLEFEVWICDYFYTILNS